MPAVIKAGELGAVAKRLTTVNLADYVAEARVVLEEAKRQSIQNADAFRARKAESVADRSAGLRDEYPYMRLSLEGEAVYCTQEHPSGLSVDDPRLEPEQAQALRNFIDVLASKRDTQLAATA